MKKKYCEFRIGKYNFKLHKKKTIIGVVLVFIFGNALLNNNLSTDISYGIRVFVEKIIPYGTFKWLDWFLSKGLRKFAHFIEYFVLGLLISKYYLLKKKSIPHLLNSIYIVLTICFVDETLQSFVGRNAIISDMWLDLFGGIVGILIYFVYKYIEFYRKQKEKK